MSARDVPLGWHPDGRKAANAPRASDGDAIVLFVAEVWRRSPEGSKDPGNPLSKSVQGTSAIPLRAGRWRGWDPLMVGGLSETGMACMRDRPHRLSWE